MKYLYLFFAIISIFIITMFTFKEDLIYYTYAKYTTNKETENNKNKYYYEDNFSYIDDYKGIEIHNKKELYESIYYIVNSGITHAERYFNIDYKDFGKDYNELFSDEIKLNTINNFVHPYNSFKSIETSLKGYKLEITINYNDYYNDNKKILIDNEVNNLINALITDNSLETKDKIKIIHDHIINNSVYDENFCIKEDKSECETTSIYSSDNAYGVLFEHNGICSGYTDLMAIFLNKLGITNYRVTNEEHTWNALKLEDNWYHLDTTWDDPISEEENILSHSYFLITTEEDSKLEQPHNFNKEIFQELN